MQPAFPYHIKDQHLWLSPDRCLYWEEEKALIVSDLHFGKTGHFRKAGIAVPQSVYREDLLRLLCQIQYFQPRQLLVVGDLFHSRENKELNLFRKWRDDFPDLQISLIEGNHDILHEDWYVQAGISLCAGLLKIGPFGFVHDITEIEEDTVVCRPLAAATPAQSEKASAAASESEKAGLTASGDTQEPLYYFSGHIHPGIRIRGMGKQALQFPCFYFGSSYAILPAFGKFTGTVSIDAPADANVFAILPPAGGERGGHFFQRSRIPSNHEPGSNRTARDERHHRPAGFGVKGWGSILQIQ